jgi:hypothetical protein
LKRAAGLVVLVLLIHGALGLWVMRAARIGVSAEPKAGTWVELRPVEHERTANETASRPIAGPHAVRNSRPEHNPAPEAAPAAIKPLPGALGVDPEDGRAATQQELQAAASPPLPTEQQELQDSSEVPTGVASDPGSTSPTPSRPGSDSIPHADSTPVSDSIPHADSTPASDPIPATASRSGSTEPGPELAAGSSLRRLRVYLGDYTIAQPVARLQIEVEVVPPHYRLRSKGEAEGLIALFYSGTLTQESRGRIGPTGLLPEQYVETRGGRRQRSVRFDHEAMQLLPTDAPEVVLPEGTQDRLSVLFQLGLIVRANPQRFVAGARIELPVATLREVRLERFEVMGDEVLIVNDRPWRALHLKRPLIQAGRDPSVQVWLGYDADLQPIRIRLEDAKGQVLDQVIDEP